MLTIFCKFCWSSKRRFIFGKTFFVGASHQTPREQNEQKMCLFLFILVDETNFSMFLMCSRFLKKVMSRENSKQFHYCSTQTPTEVTFCVSFGNTALISLAGWESYPINSVSVFFWGSYMIGFCGSVVIRGSCWAADLNTYFIHPKMT